MKVIIVGAGLIGISTAYFLAELGAEVSVIDRQESVALETSYANGGLITPGLSDPWNAPGIARELVHSLFSNDNSIYFHWKMLPSYLSWIWKFLRYSRLADYQQHWFDNIALANYSLSILNDISPTLSLNIDQGTGSLMIFRQQADFDNHCSQANALSEHGIEYKVLPQSTISSIEPALSDIQDNLAGAIHYPNDQFGNAYKYCQQLADACQKKGVKFHFNTQVEKFLENNNSIETVITDKGEMTADNIIICAGSYSSLLTTLVGIKLDVRPVKGYSISIQLDTTARMPQTSIIDYNCHAALTPLGRQLRVAGIAEIAGYDTSLKSTRPQQLIRLAKLVYPQLLKSDNPAQKIQPWTGLRPMTPDGLPIIGKTHYNNLYLNTGHGHLGWTQAPGSGKLLADLIMDKRCEINLTPYRVGR